MPAGPHLPCANGLLQTTQRKHSGWYDASSDCDVMILPALIFLWQLWHSRTNFWL